MRIQMTLIKLLLCLCGITMLAVSTSAEDLPAGVLAKFRDRIAGCWAVPAVEMKTAPVARVKIRLNRDGSLDGHPETLNPSSDKTMQGFEKSAERAILKCSPFPELAAVADRYNDWREIVVNFDPSEIFSEDDAEPDAQSTKADAEAKARAVDADEIKALPGVTFRAVPPKGFCRVEPSQDSYDAYFKAVSDLMKPHNTVLAFWLECPFLEASRAGKDVGDPSRWIVFQVENSAFGGPKPETERSRAEVLAGYAANYKKLGIKNAPIQLALESIDARLPKELNLQLDRQPQTVIGPDELAIYLAGLATKTEAGGKPIKTASVSGFTLIQSYRISVNAYRNDADETMVQAMLDEVKEMLFAVDQLSTAD